MYSWVTLEEWINSGKDPEVFKAIWNECRQNIEVAQVYSEADSAWAGYAANRTHKFKWSVSRYRLRMKDGKLPGVQGALFDLEARMDGMEGCMEGLFTVLRDATNARCKETGCSEEEVHEVTITDATGYRGRMKCPLCGGNTVDYQIADNH